jgi:importin subunit beta-1
MKNENNNQPGDSNPLLTYSDSMLQSIHQFLSIIAVDQNSNDDVIYAAIGLMGDVCAGFGVLALGILEMEPLPQLLLRGKQSRSKKTRTMASWANKNIKKLRSGLTVNGTQGALRNYSSK